MENPNQFNSNPYENPQMGWNNQNSPMYDWQQSWSPDQSAWQGQAPGNIGQSYSYNPQTGQSGWVNSAGGTQIGGSNPYGNNAMSWTDPFTGMRAIDPSAIQRMLEMMGGGGGGYQSFSPSEYGGGQITPPSAYGGGDWNVAENVVNVHDVVEAYRPTMEANIGQGFAEAGNRLGQSGFAMSTPYATALGDVERLARGQMNQRGLEYEYNAGQFDAGNQMAAMMGQNAENFNAWQTGGGWDMDAQGQNAQNAFNQWMAQNQWASEDNQGQNQYNQSQQSWLMQLLGGMF